MKKKEILRGKMGVGEGGHMGVVTGTARVVDDDEQRKAQFKQGEIYVATFPTPDDNPYLKKAAAIVTDRGGPTSHAGIVSRSQGIPFVAATLTGTEVIEDGRLIEVDGKEGVVYGFEDEQGKPVFGPPPVPTPTPSPPVAAPSLAEKMQALAKKKGIALDPEILKKMGRSG